MFSKAQRVYVHILSSNHPIVCELPKKTAFKFLLWYTLRMGAMEGASSYGSLQGGGTGNHDNGT